MENANEETKAEHKENNAEDHAEEQVEAKGEAHEENVEEEVDEAVKLHKEVDYKEKYYYLAAEMQNMQRRFDKEKDNLLKYGSEKILRDLLDVVDNFERTLGFISIRYVFLSSICIKRSTKYLWSFLSTVHLYGTTTSSLFHAVTFGLFSHHLKACRSHNDR